MKRILARVGSGEAPQDTKGSPIAGLHGVCAFWKDFELERFRSQLDEKGMRVAEQQEASVKNRRKLAETTKEFRKAASAEVAKEVGALLRAYQEEVDRLTTRAKMAEGSFLEVYQKLYEAPDPAQALQAALEALARTAELETDLKKVAVELAEYKEESSHLKNQDIKITSLNQRIRQLEAQLADKDRQLEEASQTAAAASSERELQEAQQREQTLAAALEEARASLTNMQRLHQASQNQLFSIQSRTEEEQAGLRSELDIATAEVDRAQQRLLALEGEREKVMQQASVVPADDSAQEQQTRVVEQSLRSELQSQRAAASRLQQDYSQLSATFEAETAAWQSRCQALQAATDQAAAEEARLLQELAQRPTHQQVEELRQQVQVLQAVGYNSLEGFAGEEEGTADFCALHRSQEHLPPADSIEAAEAQVGKLQAELQMLQALNSHLEEDLLAAERSVGRQLHRRSGSETMGDHGTPQAEILDFEAPASVASQQAAEGADEGEHAMLRVLVSQRDRFRSRAQQLEEQAAQVSVQVSRLRNDLEASRADNIALVERLKYVQGYQSAGRSRKALDAELGEVETRYSTAYEEKVNPFSDFRARERDQRRSKMNVLDKVMFEFGQFISGSWHARVFVFSYTVILHLLIFAILMRWSHRHSTSIKDLVALCAKQ
eukprot:jgi/Astpho2/6970/Aster-01827